MGVLTKHVPVLAGCPACIERVHMHVSTVNPPGVLLVRFSPEVHPVLTTVEQIISSL